MTIRSAIRAHPPRAALAAAGLALVFAVYWFGPQYLFVDRRIDEAAPSPVAAEPPAGPAETDAGDAGAAVTEAEASRRETLAVGEFRSLEHESSGAVAVLRLEDGSRYLRLDDLETSNGPDLRVYLSDQPASDDWFVYDDGRFVDLGPLKGNIGSSNYEIPADVDLSRFRSAVVWCRRFSVGFAVAPLEPAA